jgi:outer membrane biosynthesis protein TonB
MARSLRQPPNEWSRLALRLTCVVVIAVVVAGCAPPPAAPAPPAGATIARPETSSAPAVAAIAAPSPPAGAVDPHVHDPVSADELGISEELGVVGTDARGCGACGNATTLSTEARAALVAISRRTRHCYGVARIADPRLQGTIRVGVTIGAQGDVCSAVVRDGTMHARGVDDCVEKLFRETRGIPGIVACVRVEIPLKFDAGEVQPETPR